MQSKITEMALRTAVSSAPKFLTSNSEQIIDKIKASATQRASEIVTANGISGAITSQISLQSSAIDIAIKGIEQAYTIVSSQLTETYQKRLSFDKERQGGIASFLIPTNREEGHLSEQEIAIKGYIEIAQENHFFFNYMGIHEGILLENKEAKYYSVLPFFRMSEEINHPIASANALEKQRNGINLFFKSALNQALMEIDTHFQTDTRLGSFFLSVYHGDNYLNDLRAPRFIMMSLSNLIWNLQHPVDPRTGVPISLVEAKALCRDVQLFLNQILDEEMPPYLVQVGKIKELLISFTRKIELHTKELFFAYHEEIINEINIKDVTNSAHHVLRIMDKSMLKLLYKIKNPVSHKTEPYDQAAEDIAYGISYMNQLLNHNPRIIKKFQEYRAYLPLHAITILIPNALTPISVVNPICYSIIDALIIFSHLSVSPRKALLSAIDSLQKDTATEFTKTLIHFKLKFIDPLKDIDRANSVGIFTSSEDIASECARRFIPLLTLLIEDFRVDVDRNHKAPPSVMNGLEQSQKINASATMSNSYYHWKLSPYLFIDHQETCSRIDNFPAKQYKITQVTVLLDAVAELITKYQSFLQDTSFQEFLIRFLSEVKVEYDQLGTYIEELDAIITSTELNNRSIIGVLRRMLDDLNSSLARIQQTISSLTRTVENPEFIEKHRLLLENKINFIRNKYQELFNKEAFTSKGLMILNSSHLFKKEKECLDHQEHEKFKLRITQHTTLKETLDKLPIDGIKALDLSSNQLGQLSNQEILEGFSLLPLTLVSLDLSGNDLMKKPHHVLEKMMQSLPEKLQHLDLSWNNFGDESPYKLAFLLQKIPAHVKLLDLSRTNLANKSAEELANILSRIPSTIESLSLSNNDLASKQGDELALAFSKLKDLRLLDLSGNKFYMKSGIKLKTAFLRLPTMMETLDLSANDLGRLHRQDLELALEGLPTSLKKLDLSANILCQRTGNEFHQMIEKLPRSLKCLILSKNRIGILNYQDLIFGMETLPTGLEELELCFNNLSMYSTEKLESIFKSLCKTNLKIINLYGNNLGSKNGKGLITMITALPKSIHLLKLNNNDLVQLTGEELKSFLENLPENISHLQLNHNQLGIKSAQELIEVFQAIPQQIKHIEFVKNQLSNKTAIELANIFKQTPASLKILSLGENQFSNFSIDELKHIFQSFPQTLKELDLNKNGFERYSQTDIHNLLLSLPKQIRLLKFNGKMIALDEYHIQHQLAPQVIRELEPTPPSSKEYIMAITGLIASLSSLGLMIFSFPMLPCSILLLTGLALCVIEYQQENSCLSYLTMR